MDLGIQGLRALVTAGAGGIGLEIARAFVREGARVHVCDVDDAALAALERSDPALTWTKCDVADRAQVAKLFDDALAALGGLDCLVNNAGIAGPTGRVEEINPEDWDRCLAVDLTGQFNCARLAIPHLKQSKNPSIMNVSSQAGEHGFPLRSPYAAAKWGVIGFTKTLAMELGPNGIRVNALLPGIVAGDRVRRVIEAKAQHRGVTFKEQEQFMFQFTSIKDYVTPQQLADLVVFTASPQACLYSFQSSGRIFKTMAEVREALSPTEAASVTGVPLKQVHRIVDAGLLEGAVERRAGARVILGRGLVGLKLAHDTADLLTPEGRRRLVKRLLQRPKAKTVGENAVTVDVQSMAAAVRRGLSKLEKAKKMVAIDKDIMAGTPCFKGTRIPVHDIAAMIANGDQKAAILNAYPQLTAAHIDLAVLYAEAYPRRGRPRGKPLWQKGRPVSSEKLSLRDLPRA
jgi:NAD(P)-dependent dehydrogenase (short-subunit alcohol dehydrogenase family)/uncharacterized protein (DUF433 family)